MVQVPVVTKLSVPPVVMVHTPVVAEVKLTVKLDVAVADSVGDAPKFCAPGLLKVIDCVPLGTTLFEAAEAGPMPFALVAVTVKVYEVPLVRPVIVIGHADGPAQLPVIPKGLDVAV